MRPDTNEPTVTISVKKDEDGKEAKPAAQQQDKVLFTLVNGQVMKTANAPDNLIPGAKPMPTELAKRLMPDEGGDVKLSKKQKKKMASKGRDSESASNSPAMQRAPAPAAPYQQVDLDKLRLPDGVSISKISGPVPERRYFPCKETDAAPRDPGVPGVQNPASMGPPWSNNPYSGAPPPTYTGPTGFPSPSYGGFGAAPPNSNVIVVDTNSLDEKEKVSKKAKKKAATPSSPWGAPSMPQQNSIPGIGLGGMAPQQQAPAKPKEWTPAQYGGYVPPAGGGGGGQVLIKSVNGKVVITPVPGTGATSQAPSSSSSAPSTGVPAPKRTSPPAPTPARTSATSSAPLLNTSGPSAGSAKVPSSTSSSSSSSTSRSTSSNSSGQQPSSVKRPLAPTAAPRVPTSVPARPVSNQQVNGTSNNNINGNNNIENQAPNEEMMNGNHTEEEKRNKKNKTKTKRNENEKLEEINSIFEPREAGAGDMSATDREIEQFKQFCLDSKPAQNRAKVSFDVRNIAFKKKA